ncbi:MAG TPA: TIGR00269 family protein [Methanomicrobia archaeon]|nr:TIGR00269 family protein [Methanomicrobia archaeon]
MNCSKRSCSNSAIVHQRYSGLHLCDVHFVEDVERKVKREMRKRLMVERGDTIAIALSGGKDSSALLLMLTRLFHNRPDLTFFAIAVDEGIYGFRAVTLAHAEQLANQLGVDFFRFSFAEEFGVTLNQIASRGFEQAPCTFCGVLRRKLLDRKAKELGATKMATAHNLDDEVQTIMINYLRGDLQRLARLNGRREEFVPRIKPLRDVPEKEIALYAFLAGIPLITASCPYAARSFRFSVKGMLNELERKHPGTKYAVMRGYQRLAEFLPHAESSQILLRCERCGDASATRICKACAILERMQ